MSNFTIASFNTKNLIGSDKEYYRFESYTPEEYAWKENWLADQLYAMNADIVCFQEIFEQAALESVIDHFNITAAELNDNVIPDQSKRYRRKAIFHKLKVKQYQKDQLFFASNDQDGKPGQRRPGLAMVSRHGFEETPMVIQTLAEPITIQFPALDKSNGVAGEFTIKSLSRPIIKAKVKVGKQVLTIYNCHLKSKLGEYLLSDGQSYPDEFNLLSYDPAARALGELRAMLRRSAEAYVLRKYIAQSIDAGEAVMVMGDFNDSEYSVSSSMIKGEKPFKNYAWMRRHDAEHKGDRYSDEEDKAIREQIEKYQLQSAEMQFIKNSQRDMVYTTAFNGVYESIDQILMSKALIDGSVNAVGKMDYFSVFNDHITNGAHDEAPYNKLASDHGQIMAHMRLFD